MPHVWLSSICVPPISCATSFSVKIYAAASMWREPADGGDSFAREPPLIEFTAFIYRSAIFGKAGICLGLVVELGGPC